MEKYKQQGSGVPVSSCLGKLYGEVAHSPIGILHRDWAQVPLHTAG